MNIGQLDAPNPTLDTMNPVTQGLGRAIQRNLLMQERKKQSQLMPFVAPQAQQALIAAQLQNKYFGPQAEAVMGLQGAQAQNALAEAARTRFMLQNPGFLGGDASKELQGLIAMGLPVGSLTNQPTQSQGAPQPANAPSLNIPSSQGNGRLVDAILAANSNGTTFGSQGPNPTGSNDSAAYSPADQMRQGDNNTPAPAGGSLGDAIAGTLQTAPSAEQQNLLNRAMPFTSAFPGLSPFAATVMDKSFAAPAYQTQMLKAYNWAKTTEDGKNYMLAQAAGMGIDPSSAIEAFTNGKTIKELAVENGFDPNNLPAIDPLPTKGNIETLVKRRAALAESQKLSKFVSEGLGDYARTINGYSPKQIMDAISGQNEDQQANFLAARAIAPILADVNLNLAQGSVGQEAMQSLLKKSMTDMNAFQALTSPSVYKKMQSKIDSELTDAFNAAAKSYEVGNKKSEGSSESSKNVTYEFKDGKLVKTS